MTAGRYWNRRFSSLDFGAVLERSVPGLLPGPGKHRILRRLPRFHLPQCVPAPPPRTASPQTDPGYRRSICFLSRHHHRTRTRFVMVTSLNPSAWRTVSLVRISRTADVGQSGLLGLTTSWRSTIPSSWYSSTSRLHSCSFQPSPQSSIHWLHSML